MFTGKLQPHALELGKVLGGSGLLLGARGLLQEKEGKMVVPL
jgi:hypothetical protein